MQDEYLRKIQNNSATGLYKKATVVVCIILFIVLLAVLYIQKRFDKKPNASVPNDKSGLTTVSLSDKWSREDIAKAVTTYSKSQDGNSLPKEYQQIIADSDIRTLEQVDALEKAAKANPEAINDGIMNLTDSSGISLGIEALKNRKKTLSLNPVSMVATASAEAAYPINDLTLAMTDGVYTKDNIVTLVSGLHDLAINNQYITSSTADGIRTFLDAKFPGDLHYPSIHFSSADFSVFSERLKQAPFSSSNMDTITGLDLSRFDVGSVYHLNVGENLSISQLSSLFSNLTLSTFSVELNGEQYRLADFDSRATLESFLSSKFGSLKTGDSVTIKALGNHSIIYEDQRSECLYHLALVQRLNTLKTSGNISNFDFEIKDTVLLPNYLSPDYIEDPEDTGNNFLFHRSTNSTMRSTLIEYYDKIEAVIGERATEDPIRVYVSPNCVSLTAYYRPDSNSIYICKGYENSKPVFVHELVHAFDWWNCFANPMEFEEGTAVAVTDYVLGFMNPEDTGVRMLIDGMITAETGNLPFRNYWAQHNNNAYMIGSNIMAKAYLEDNNFFKSYRQNLQSYIDSQLSALGNKIGQNEETLEFARSIHQLDRYVNNVLSVSIDNIEGIPATEWIVSRFALYEGRAFFNQASTNPDYSVKSVYIEGNLARVMTSNAGNLRNIVGSIFLNASDQKFVLRTEGFYLNLSGVKITSCKINVFDYEGSNLGQINVSDCNSDGSKSIPIPLPSSYQGLLKFVIDVSYSDGRSSQNVQYYAKLNSASVTAPIYGIVVGSNDGDTVNMEADLENPKGDVVDHISTENIPIQNGLFIVPGDQAKGAGKFTFTINARKDACDQNGCRKTVETTEKQINKINIAGYTTVINLGEAKCCYSKRNIIDKYTSFEKEEKSCQVCSQIPLDSDGKPIGNFRGTESFIPNAKNPETVFMFDEVGRLYGKELTW